VIPATPGSTTGEGDVSCATCDWRADYLARAVEAALLRGRCLNQAVLVAVTNPSAEDDVRRLLMFWLIQRTMRPQPEHRLSAAQRAELELAGLTVDEACGCDQEPPAGQELTAV
jgi:hypothetical protein